MDSIGRDEVSSNLGRVVVIHKQGARRGTDN